MILVTGGTGLVGAHLLLRLSEKGEKIRASYRSEKRKDHIRDVFALYSDEADYFFDQIEWVKCDLLDIMDVEKLCKGVEEVFHCAALVSFHPSDRVYLLKGNPSMTHYLVNQSIQEGVRRFNYVSSVAALGKPAQGEEGSAINENNIWKDDPDNSVYAQSKYLAEMEVWRGMEEGLEAAIVNPAIILGSGFGEEGSSSIFGLVQRGFRYFTPGINGFVDVRDVVQSLMMISEKRINRQRYVIVSECIPYKDLFTMIAQKLGKPVPDKEAKPWMTETIRVVHWLREKLGGRKATITRETAASAQRISRFDNAKSRKELDIAYTPIAQTISFVGDCILQESNVKA